ncbi:CLUMA_CG007493, isoform A [Clunio marinus]|uniref:CLUMA_CG007493, isoform A n=1 Tax=Clunio marinus TaxID=568069 RepID=A0A1J1I0T9_9DIPT|nr:CLUMA_CG007493, isoform A [Clunio marinus]
MRLRHKRLFRKNLIHLSWVRKDFHECFSGQHLSLCLDLHSKLRIHSQMIIKMSTWDFDFEVQFEMKQERVVNEMCS